MMNISRQLLLGSLIAVAGFSVSAQEFKVGIVNLDRIFREANSAKAAQTKLEAEFGKRDKELNDVATQLKAPVLGLYGGKDQGIPLDTVDKMKSALASGSDAAKASQFVVYPDAGHAFHADYRPSYLKEAADDGWRRAQAWFKTHGVA